MLIDAAFTRLCYQTDLPSHSRGAAMTGTDHVRRRERAKALGLRPRRIWVPDTRRIGFAEECRRQSQIVAAADTADAALDAFLAAALAAST